MSVQNSKHCIQNTFSGILTLKPISAATVAVHVAKQHQILLHVVTASPLLLSSNDLYKNVSKNMRHKPPVFQIHFFDFGVTLSISLVKCRLHCCQYLSFSRLHKHYIKHRPRKRPIQTYCDPDPLVPRLVQRYFLFSSWFVAICSNAALQAKKCN